MAGADRLDLIEIACFECGKTFVVCFRDYRGQRYCGRRCQELGYRSRKREAGCKYQGTPNGRDRHRRRQQALRDRRVTHGATRLATDGSDTVSPRAQVKAPEPLLKKVPDGGTQPESRSAVRHCFVCGGAGVVIFRITSAEPEGLRVPTMKPG